MALLVTVDNRPIFLPAREANLLWLVFTGERKGTPKTRDKVKKIDKWYLNRQTAPKSYIERNPVKDDKALAGQVRLPYID